MITLDSILVADKNKLASTWPWLILIEISIPDGSTLYFVRNREDIWMGAQKYTAFPFIIDPVRQVSKGEIPTVQVRFSNVTRTLQVYAEDYEGLVGQDVVYKIVAAATVVLHNNVNYISKQDHISSSNNEPGIGVNWSDYWFTGGEGGSSWSSGQSYLGFKVALTYNYIILDTRADSTWLTISLGVANPIMKRYPLYRYIATHCNWQFRGVECRYDESDSATEWTINTSYYIGDIVKPSTTIWELSTAYSVGDRVVSTTDNGHRYRCTAAGTSGSTEPIWRTPAGSITYDSTVEWEEDTHYYRCTDAGLSHATTEPSWTTVIASTYIDNGVIWKENYCKRTLENCRELDNSLRYGGKPGVDTGGPLLA